MQPLAVEASLLRAVLASDVKLSVGRELMARVAAAGAEGRGVLSLAGMLLEAELPANVRAGDELRLQVRELTPEKVVLAIRDDAPQQPPPIVVQTPRVPLPGGGFVRVAERDAGRGRAGSDPGGQTHTLSLRYDAPTLGAIDLRFTLSSGALVLTVGVAPGAHDVAQEQAAVLQRALTAATERSVTVTVAPRREPVEVFA
jgi:hypothetical protein